MRAGESSSERLDIGHLRQVDLKTRTQPECRMGYASGGCRKGGTRVRTKVFCSCMNIRVPVNRLLDLTTFQRCLSA